jgi:hypothetical protein
LISNVSSVTAAFGGVHRMFNELPTLCFLHLPSPSASWCHLPEQATSTWIPDVGDSHMNKLKCFPLDRFIASKTVIPRSTSRSTNVDQRILPGLKIAALTSDGSLFVSKCLAWPIITRAWPGDTRACIGFISHRPPAQATPD